MSTEIGTSFDVISGLHSSLLVVTFGWHDGLLFAGLESVDIGFEDVEDLVFELLVSDTGFFTNVVDDETGSGLVETGALFIIDTIAGVGNFEEVVFGEGEVGEEVV